MKFRSTRPLRAVAPLLAVVALCACAPSRTIVTGPEADRAERFFAGLPERVVFPVKASYSGTAVPVAGDAVPFLAGISAPSPEEELVGLYDPLGRGVAFLTNDGRRVAIVRGPAADLAGFRGAAPIDTGTVSMARILSGAPGYAAAAVEAARYKEIKLLVSDGRQTLRSDPGRRFLAGAEYRVSGMRVTVDYPGRESAESTGSDRPLDPGSDVYTEEGCRVNPSPRRAVLPSIALFLLFAACGGGKPESAGKGAADSDIPAYGDAIVEGSIGDVSGFLHCGHDRRLLPRGGRIRLQRAGPVRQGPETTRGISQNPGKSPPTEGGSPSIFRKG